MLKDITIGQYLPGNSFLHKMDPRSKILITISYMVIIFLTKNMIGLIFSIFIIGILYTLSKIPIKMIAKSLKPIIPILIFTGILNMFLIDGNIIFQFYIFKITDKGIELAIFMAVRIICLISVTSLLTYTTSPMILTDGIERLLSPLNKLKFPVHELAMMMTIAIRFIPTLIEEIDKIMIAQKSRGADIDTGGFIKRAKALVPILIPLFISAFRRAEDLSLAMESRCYNGGIGRTKMKQLKYGYFDVIGFIFVIFNFSAVILINIYL